MYWSIIFVAQLMFVKSPGLLKQSIREKCIVNANKIIACLKSRLLKDLKLDELVNDIHKILQEYDEKCYNYKKAFEKQYKTKYPLTTDESIEGILEVWDTFYNDKLNDELVELSEKKTTNNSTSATSDDDTVRIPDELWDALKKYNVKKDERIFLEFAENEQLNAIVRVYYHFYKLWYELKFIINIFRLFSEMTNSIEAAKNMPLLANRKFDDYTKQIILMSRNMTKDFGCSTEESQHINGLPAENEPDFSETSKQLKKDLGALLKSLLSSNSVNSTLKSYLSLQFPTSAMSYI